MTVLKTKLNTACCSLFIVICGVAYAADTEDTTTNDGLNATNTDMNAMSSATESSPTAEPFTSPESFTSMNPSDGTSTTESSTGTESSGESTTPDTTPSPTEFSSSTELTDSEKLPTTSESSTISISSDTSGQSDAQQKQANSSQKNQEKVPEMGIDTVDLTEPQGNWLFKRTWWEMAEKKYETIHTYVDSVFESRNYFIAQRSDIKENVLDPFYISIGFGQGELKRIVDELTTHLEKERQEKGNLTEQEQDILKELRKEENTLKLIKRNVEGIAQADKRINETLNALFEQIKVVRECERASWESFKKIGRVLSDIEARKLYYEMISKGEEIMAIQSYIRNEFTQFFDQLCALIKNQVSSLQESIEALKEQDLDLREQLDKLQAKPVQCEIIKPEKTTEEKEDATQGHKQEESGIFDSYIIQPISNFFSYLSSSFTSLYTWIMGESANAENTNSSEQETDEDLSTIETPGDNEWEEKEEESEAPLSEENENDENEEEDEVELSED